MALCAIMTEVTRDVVRVCRSREFCLMTLIAVRKLQLIVTIRVARLTLHGNMCARQREPCCGMVKCRSRPIRH